MLHNRLANLSMDLKKTMFQAAGLFKPLSMRDNKGITLFRISRVTALNDFVYILMTDLD